MLERSYNCLLRIQRGIYSLRNCASEVPTGSVSAAAGEGEMLIAVDDSPARQLRIYQDIFFFPFISQSVRVRIWRGQTLRKNLEWGFGGKYVCIGYLTRRPS